MFERIFLRIRYICYYYIGFAQESLAIDFDTHDRRHGNLASDRAENDEG